MLSTTTRVTALKDSSTNQPTYYGTMCATAQAISHQHSSSPHTQAAPVCMPQELRHHTRNTPASHPLSPRSASHHPSVSLHLSHHLSHHLITRLHQLREPPAPTPQGPTAGPTALLLPLQLVTPPRPSLRCGGRAAACRGRCTCGRGIVQHGGVRRNYVACRWRFHIRQTV